MMDCRRYILCIIGMVITINTTNAVGSTKVWHGNTNFNNPYNWRPSHVPCSNSRTIFDSSQSVLVRLSPIVTMVKELVLPYNGAIVFPTNGALTFTTKNLISNQQSNCKNEDVFYVGTSLSAWMNPRSWGPEDENSNALINSPVPHAEQIPCQHDKVVFPSGSSFRVILPRVSTAIGSLNIEGQALDTEAWRVMTESNVGRMQFIGDPNVVTILGEDGADHPCRNPTGCYCGNGGAITMGRVCSYAGGNKCDIPPCFQPVRPIGHCCDICGATIQLEYLPHAFVLSALEDHVRRFTSSDVKAHVGKTSATTNHVQIVLVDAGSYQERSVESAKRLLQVLNNDMSLGVGKITLEASGPALDLSEMYISHSPEKIVGFIFAGCALLVLAFLLFLAYRDTRFTGTEAPPFVFSRFDNMSSRSEGPVIRVWGEGVAKEAEEEKEFVQAQEASDWVTMESILAPSQPQAFDNPMYNKQLEGGKGKKTEGTKYSGGNKDGRHGGTSGATTMENPVYSALKAGEEREKQNKSDGEEKREPPPPPMTKRKVRSKAPKKVKVKRELLSEEDTDDSTGSENMTTVEDLD